MIRLLTAAERVEAERRLARLRGEPVEVVDVLLTEEQAEAHWAVTTLMAPAWRPDLTTWDEVRAAFTHAYERLLAAQPTEVAA